MIRKDNKGSGLRFAILRRSRWRAHSYFFDLSTSSRIANRRPDPHRSDRSPPDASSAPSTTNKPPSSNSPNQTDISLSGLAFPKASDVVSLRRRTFAARNRDRKSSRAVHQIGR